MTHENKKMGDYYTANDVQQIIMCVDIMFLTARILFGYPNKSLIQTTIY